MDLGFQKACAELKRIREEGVRDSERVVDLWCDCVSRYTNRLGDEKWALYEQVFISALDCGRLEAADACLVQLSRQFPNSQRIRRYEAMRLEAEDNLDAATEIYKKMSETDKLDSLSRKRLVAVLKARGRSVEAIKELTGYLKDFCTDFEAWLELSELYLNECDYKKAAFCMEELILSNPHHHLYHQRYAEIKYTEGTTESMELAKSYFAQAVRLNPNNMRALFGLLLAAGNCASSTNKSSTSASRRESARLAQWAAAQVAERYRAAGSKAAKFTTTNSSNSSDAAGSDVATLALQLSLCCSPTAAAGDASSPSQGQQQPASNPPML
ncbi:hypothetical protein BOX15_Mlig018160g1 [Macrostomum lignano]|uniref:Uncharacterized protein n=2 Tax=Macrostomum lignano TaxID=282301 RepID=A0A267H512_9PLAT|nr:hypothetical protein BOX15_Mlig018160g1 [Macrostomum lignano]